MAKLHVGDKLPNFVYDTAFENGKIFYEELKKPTYLWFLRYYGCTICQVDMYYLRENYRKFTERGAQVKVVLQSGQAVIAEELKKDESPFEIICDPEQKLYSKFDVYPARKKFELLSLGVLKKMKEARVLGMKHGKYEGNENQLPAIFLIDVDRTIKLAYYGKNVTDIPELDVLLQAL